MSWFWVVLGGMLIGASASVMFLVMGRITGISGIVSSALFSRINALKQEVSQEKEAGQSWRWFFLAGLVLGPAVLHYFLSVPIPQTAPTDWWLAILPGFIVGLGVGLGSGCTSGHGICGLSRGSRRSIIATGVFMVIGILTVTVQRIWF